MRGRSLGKSLASGAASVLFGLAAAGTTWAVTSTPESDEERSFDARTPYNESFAQTMETPQAAAIEALRRRTPDLQMTWNTDLGIVTSISSNTGYLTGPAAQGARPLSVAMRFVGANLSALGLTPADVSEYRITDTVFSRVTGATHIYTEQMYQGIPVYQGALQVNVNRNGRIMSVNNGFVPNIAAAVNAVRPTLSASNAMSSMASSMGMSLAAAPQALGPAVGVQQVQRFEAQGMSLEPMTAKLMYLPVRAGEVRLVWNMGTMWTADNQHSYEFNVDAETGQVWTRADGTSAASFRVYARPVESPAQTSPLPPADARTLAVNPENALASPNGWLAANSMSSTANNNVRACTDRDANNVCDTNPVQPNCTGQVCDFAINLSAMPLQTSANAAITNLFYWNNIIHDIQYQYGFDEQAGNFQQNNFGRGGAGNDAVFAQAQDGSGTCNANFSTPADGGAGRMQMFLCNRATPNRDGDFDNGVITHEYGHGISTRQVGGPSRSCLGGQQQAGEGWSDWFGLVYTAKVGDTGPQARGVGTYLFGLNPNTGQSIRDLPYSTNNAVNNWTYESIRTAGLPHGVGSRWSQAIWEVYWALVNRYGFEADLINFNPNDPNEAGNKRALFYINEGLKLTPCNPTFINNRDAIMQVAMDNFGGADVCTLWTTFAGFGLGTDARSANTNQASAVNGFAVPAQCRGGQQPPQQPPGQCTNPRFTANFDTTANGFSRGADSCTTGQFVRGAPTAVTDGGVTTQPAGAAAGTAALFTAINSSAGVNDVDGGTCEVRSPVVRVGAGSVTVNLSYFHGQRDAGGDDAFVIDVLNANGAVVNTIVNLGAATRNAAWTRASSTFNLAAPTDLRLRVRATDGAASGDLVEGGIDELQICGNPG